MCMGETKHKPSFTPLRFTICSTWSVICTISRRFRVSKVRYSVWLFIVAPGGPVREWRRLRLPLILKNVVTSMGTNEAEALSQRGLEQLAEGLPDAAVRSFCAAIAADP